MYKKVNTILNCFVFLNLCIRKQIELIWGKVA